MSLRGAPGTPAGGGGGASYAHRQLLDRFVEVPVAQASTRLARYMMVARQVIAQAKTFEKQGDLDRAYIFYKRFLRLAVDCLPAHPEYNKAGSSKAPDRAWLVEERRAALAALEKVSAAMDAEWGGKDAAAAAAPAPAPAPTTAAAAADDPASAMEAELQRRLQALRGGEKGASATQLLVSSPLLDDEAEAAHDGAPTNGGVGASPLPEPSAPPPLPFDDGPAPSDADARDTNPAAVIDFDTAFKALRVSADDADGKVKGGVRYYPALPASPVPVPMAKAKEAPSSGRAPGQLRPLVLASGLIGKFLEIAEPNSRKPPDGVETCGVLAGVQDEGQVRFTTLIIPKQEGTGNTVSTTHEEELYFHCEAQGLIMLGWIHTHPSQDCFMSSVDVHTHCAYQTMLPEAVAVVVSLRDARKRVGVFRLTEPDGMQLIQQCTLRGFHPHPLPDDQIYRDHHRVVWEDTGFLVVDQR